MKRELLEGAEIDSEYSIKSGPNSTPEPISQSTPQNNKKRKADGPSSTKRAKTTKSDKSPKSKWSSEEDDVLIGIMERVLKEHVWPQAKIDGRLVSRTSYGVQYHALMLLRQGTGRSAPTPKTAPKK